MEYRLLHHRKSSMLPTAHFFFFFFNDTAPPDIYTLSLHDALPISGSRCRGCRSTSAAPRSPTRAAAPPRSEEHTSELQSQFHLVCRLLLEKKKPNTYMIDFVQKKTQN